MEEGKVLSASIVREAAPPPRYAECFGNQMGFQFDGAPTMEGLFAPVSGSLVLEVNGETGLRRSVGLF